MMFRDILVTHNDRLGAGAQRGDARSKRCQQTAANDNVITACIQRHVHGRRIVANGSSHCMLPAGADAFRNSLSAVMMSVTIVSCGVSRDCTVRSASA